MRAKYPILVPIIASLAPFVPCRAQTMTAPAELVSRGALGSGDVAIRNVSVVTMRSETVLTNAAVLARNGRITYVGPETGLRVPRGTTVVDGAGGYLIPGLADMHTHLFSDGEQVHDSAGPAELGVMVANGVTAARLMIGTPEQLALREAVRAGTVIGPQLWVASPSSRAARLKTPS